MTLGPKQYVYRASCAGASVRLRVNPGDSNWIIIKRPGQARMHAEIADNNVQDVVDRFHAIDGDPEKFAAFVQTFFSDTSKSRKGSLNGKHET